MSQIVLGVLTLTVALLSVSACTSGPLAPRCDRQKGSLIDATGTVAAAGRVSYEVTSQINSNLFITATWSNADAELGLSATVLACGVHAGCEVGTSLTSPQAQPTLKHLEVDGSLGKRYRIDVVGDPTLEQVFTIRATYDTGTCT